MDHFHNEEDSFMSSPRPSPRSPRRTVSSPERHPHTVLSPEASKYLKDWMMSPEHVGHPYPNEEEKVEMMQITGMNLKQLNNWFVNNRKRYWKPRVMASSSAMQSAVASSSPPLTPILHENNTEDTSMDDIPAIVTQSQPASVPPPPELFVDLQGGGLRDADVLATKISFSRSHPGNVFYRQLVDQYCQLLEDPKDSSRYAAKIFQIITVDRQGRFLKQAAGQSWSIMPKEAVMRKVVMALKNGQYRFLGRYKNNEPKKPSQAKRKRKPLVITSYQAQQGEGCVIHPYTLELMTQVCNIPREEEALRLLDVPLVKQNGQDETKQERLQRLQLRHRYYAAWDGGMPPKEFSRKLLEFWGGRLVETQAFCQEQSGETTSVETNTPHAASLLNTSNEVPAVEKSLPLVQEHVSSEKKEHEVPFQVDFSVPNPLVQPVSGEQQPRTTTVVEPVAAEPVVSETDQVLPSASEDS